MSLQVYIIVNVFFCQYVSLTPTPTLTLTPDRNTLRITFSECRRLFYNKSYSLRKEAQLLKVVKVGIGEWDLPYFNQGFNPFVQDVKH